MLGFPLMLILYFITRYVNDYMLLTFGALKLFGHFNISKLMSSHKRCSLHDVDSKNICSELVMGHYMCFHK